MSTSLACVSLGGRRNSRAQTSEPWSPAVRTRRRGPGVGEPSGDISGALFRIAEAASGATDMASLYPAIRDILGEACTRKLSRWRSIDRGRKRISLPFVAGRAQHRRGRGNPDQVTGSAYDPRKMPAICRRMCSARSGRSWCTRQRIEKLVADGKVAWRAGCRWSRSARRSLADGRRIGAVEARASARADATRRWTSSCWHLPANSSDRRHTRFTAVEETRQRNAELALVNEVGTALVESSSSSTQSSSSSASGLPRSSP